MIDKLITICGICMWNLTLTVNANSGSWQVCEYCECKLEGDKLVSMNYQEWESKYGEKHLKFLDTEYGLHYLNSEQFKRDNPF